MFSMCTYMYVRVSKRILFRPSKTQIIYVKFVTATISLKKYQSHDITALKIMQIILRAFFMPNISLILIVFIPKIYTVKRYLHSNTNIRQTYFTYYLSQIRSCLFVAIFHDIGFQSTPVEALIFGTTKNITLHKG